MTIVDLLKLPNASLRISYGTVWLFFDEFLSKWTVLNHLYRTINIIETESESEAVAAFCEAAGIEVTE